MGKIIKGLLLLCLVQVSLPVYSAAAYYGPTQLNEHLYRIAMKVRPQKQVTIPQMMIALLKANPQAFTQTNINTLKAGYRLQLPSIRLIQQTSSEKAEDIVHKQNKEWQKGSLLLVVKAAHDQVPSKTQLLEASAAAASAAQASLQVVAEASTQVNQVAAQVDYLIEERYRFEQQVTTQLTALQKQTQNLEFEVGQLSEQLDILSDHFDQLTKANAEKFAGYHLLLDSFKRYGIGVLIGLLTLLLLGYVSVRSFRTSKVLSSPDPKKDDYDFMGSKESIPSKLDLARVYMEMGDLKAAKKALKEVLNKGDHQQKQGAQDLLDEMNVGV